MSNTILSHAVTTDAPAPGAVAHPGRGARRGLAGLLALGVVLVVAAGTLGVRTWQVGSTLGSALFPVEDIVELAAVAVGTVVAGRAGLHALVALACVLAGRRGRPWAAGERAVARHAPAVVRRLARAAAGAGIGLALTAPTAMALPSWGTGAATSADRPAVVVELGWRSTDGLTGDRTTTNEDTAVRSTRPRPGPAPERSSLVNRGLPAGTERAALVVVEPGDTLWALAADQLADRLAAERATERATERAAERAATEPSAPDIAAAVTRWHQANRQVLGANPDLIRPGMVLHQP